MTIQAHLHDGTILEFPDGTDQSVITNTVQGVLGKQGQPNETAPDNHSFLENLSGGIWSGVGRKIGALGELTGLVSPADVDKFRQSTEQLRSTAGGSLGEIGSGIALDMALGGGLAKGAGALASLLPKAQYVPAVASAMKYAGESLGAPKNILQGLTGGVEAGLLQDRGTNDNLIANVAKGGLLGTVIPAAAGALKLGKHAFVDTLMPSGNDKLAGQVLRSVSDDPQAVIAALKTPAEILPGSQPNIAEASGDRGLASYLAVLRSRDPLGSGAKTKLGALRQTNENARLNALENLVQGTPATRADLIPFGSQGGAQGNDIASQMAYRKALTDPLYAAGNQASVPITDELAGMLKTPTGRAAVQRANRLAADMQLPGAQEGKYIPEDATHISGQELHLIKQAFNDIRNSRENGGLSGFEQKIVDNLTANIKNHLPEAHKEADKLFAEASKPISQMQVRDALLKGQNAVLQDTEGASLYGNKFASALRDQDKLAREATGWERSKGLADFMTPQQMQTLDAIKNDISRQAVTDKMGAAMGSPTGQNLHGDRIIRGLLDDVGLPQNWTEAINQTMHTLPGLKQAINVADMGVSRRVADAAVDPQYAAKLMMMGVIPNPYLQRMSQTARLLSSAFPAGLLAAESNQ